MQSSQQARLQELRDHFESEVIPDIRARHDRKVDHLSSDLENTKEQFTTVKHKLNEYKAQALTLEQSCVEAETQLKIKVDQLNDELKQAND